MSSLWKYLMWNRWGDTPIPLEHVVKYYENEKADKEIGGEIIWD